MIDTDKLSTEVKHAIASNLGWHADDAEPYIEMMRNMTPEEAFAAYCTWYGIINYSEMLLNAIDELRAADVDTEPA